MKANTNWKHFLHEFQHVEFGKYFRQFYDSNQRRVIKGEKLADFLDAEIIKQYGAKKVAKLESLMKRQLPELAANETMSVDAELKALGWRRYKPGVGSSNEKYALRYQITELRKVEQANPIEFTDRQKKTLEEAIQRHDKVLPMRDKMVEVGAYGAFLGTTFGIGGLIGNFEKNFIEKNKIEEIYYDYSGHLIGRSASGGLYSLEKKSSEK